MITAEQFLHNNYGTKTFKELNDAIFDCRYDADDITEKMVEFAKLHVKAALEAASEKVSATKYFEERDEDGELIMDGDTEEANYCFPLLESGYIIVANKDSILNAYPEENIQ